jgi:hypothetical protein
MNSRTVEYEPASSPALTLYQRALLGLLGLRLDGTTRESRPERSPPDVGTQGTSQHRRSLFPITFAKATGS